MRFKKLGIALMCAAALAVSAVPAEATPIVYGVTLVNGVPVVGTNIQPAGSESNPEGANYYSFFAAAGSVVSVDGSRINPEFDMAFWLLEGLFADTSAFGGSFDAGDPGFLAFGDDQDEVPGPFGDPFVQFVAPTTSFYTIAIVNFASGPSTAPMDFTIQVNGAESPVPEPASLALLGAGLGLLAARIRRRKTA